MKIRKTKYAWFAESDLRLDASYHLSDGPATRILFSVKNIPTISLRKASKKIFLGARFKRTFVPNENVGIPYITGTDMVKSAIDGGRFLSKKYTKNKEKLSLYPGWILVSCSGTLGNTVLTDECYNGRIGTHDLIRIIPNEDELPKGFLYAYLSSKFGYGLLTQASYGGVVKHIEPHHIEDIPIPRFSNNREKQIHELVMDSSNLRVEANKLLSDAETKMKENSNLPNLEKEDYEYFGAHSDRRKVSTFKIKAKNISSLTINAFNYSRKVELLHDRIKSKGNWMRLEDCLDESCFFNTGSFKRLEIQSPNSIQLINQSDIFNIKMIGKMLAPIYVKTDNLVSYGEVLIAGVGTLGESETFCRALFAGEELEGKLISGEFIRMKTTEKMPSGYLYTFLNSDYGFRFIRATQTGTKLCRPIKKLLKNIPIPTLEEGVMNEIDRMVKEAHSKRYLALEKENQAISLIENEIESWQS